MSNQQMKNLHDNEIIESIKKGNQTDFAILVDRYKNRAFSMLLRMLKNESEAEEVLQDCFMKVFNGLGTFRQEAKFSTWFYRIVYNTALTRLSAKKRKIENDMLSTDDFLHLPDINNDNIFEKKDIAEMLTSLVQKLPANYGTVINMFYIDGMSCEEISDVMSTSVSNVKVLLHRSRSALREILVKNDFIEELL
jgi:RNA polymerase sigma factor (sigma-70 family)